MSVARHLDNIVAPAALELDQQRRGAANAAHEGRGPHCPLDLDRPASVGKVEQPILELDLRNIVADEHGAAAQFLESHKPLPLKYAEQRSSGPCVVNERKPVTRVKPLIRRMAVAA